MLAECLASVPWYPSTSILNLPNRRLWLHKRTAPIAGSTAKIVFWSNQSNEHRAHSYPTPSCHDNKKVASWRLVVQIAQLTETSNPPEALCKVCNQLQIIESPRSRIRNSLRMFRGCRFSANRGSQKNASRIVSARKWHQPQFEVSTHCLERGSKSVLVREKLQDVQLAVANLYLRIP